MCITVYTRVLTLNFHSCLWKLYLKNQNCNGLMADETPSSWWRHQMETYSALLAICAENSPVTGEFTAQWPVVPSLNVFFDLRLNELFSKQSWGWWFETPSSPLWRHSNDERREWLLSNTDNSWHVLWLRIKSKPIDLVLQGCEYEILEIMTAYPIL